MKSEHIKHLLNERYSKGDESMIAFEVNEGTGSMSGKRADAMAFSLWPSKDYKLIGFEIKVSRGDWLNELKQPEKSHALSQYCDEWYLVAPKGVLAIDELPKTWGFIEASEKALKIKIQAPKRESVQPDRAFMASLLRSMVRKYQDASFKKTWIEQEGEKIRRNVEKIFESRNKRNMDDLQVYKEVIEEFHKKTGIYLRSYSLNESADLFNLVRKLDREDLEKALDGKIKLLELELENLKKSKPLVSEQMKAIKKITEE